MQTFRAYLLDEEGKIQRGDWIEASNENEALATASDLWGGDRSRIEVWFGSRKVGGNPTSASADS